jgi:hypothetical protein
MDILYDVVGYEGFYKINKNGDVWSCRSKIFLKPHYNNYGYLMVSLGRKKKCLLHRLIAIQFIPNPYNLDMIDHIDQNSTNNSLENLRWATKSTNEQNTTRHKDNKTGFKHIDTKRHKRKNGFTEYWRIRITHNNFKCILQYNKNKYTLEEVVEFRNKIYINNNIQKYD